MSRYRVEINQIIELSLEDGYDILERTQTPEWRNQFYPLTWEQAVGILALSLAIDHQGLSQLDGWADLDDCLAQAEIVFDEICLVEKEEDKEIGQTGDN